MSWPALEQRLEPGESVVRRGRFHPWVLSGGVSFGAVWLLAALLVVTRNDLAPVVTGRVVLAGVGAALLCIVPPWLRWRRAEFVLTEHRLLVGTGVLRRRTVEVPLAGAEITAAAPLLGRLLGYGTLAVRGSDGADYVFTRVSAPEQFQPAMRRLRDKTRPD